MPKVVVTLEMIDEINRLYDKGLKMKDIGKKLKIGHGTVSRYVEHPRPKGREEDSFLIRKVIKHEPQKCCNNTVKIFEKGTKLAITEDVRMGSSKKIKNTRKGTVIFSNEDYFTVKLKNYPEGFKYSDILTGDVQIRKTNN